MQLLSTSWFPFGEIWRSLDIVGTDRAVAKDQWHWSTSELDNLQRLLQTTELQ